MEETHLIGSMLGTAVGDALGLPYEGLSPRRSQRLLRWPDRYRLLWGRGMVSDDTEHTCMVAQALIASGGQGELFERFLARYFRGWLLALPAGVGLATLRAIAKLWLGFSPGRSGVFSAGNGPAMRAAILGVAIADLNQLRVLVSGSTRITHTDPKAEYGAFAIALAAHQASQLQPVSGAAFLQKLSDVLEPAAQELLALIQQVVASVDQGESTSQFALRLGFVQGVSGYVYHSVPIAIHAWLSHPQDFRAAVIGAIACGGDTDSVAAMVGGIVGASVGKAGIPAEWLQGLWEPFRSVAWMEQLARQLAGVIHTGQPARPLSLSGWTTFLRNLGFLVVVLGHGVRRLGPPY